MPYTNEKTSNTIEDKNTIKSQDLFLLWISTQNKAVTECVIIDLTYFYQKSLLFFLNPVRTEIKRALNRTEKGWYEYAYCYNPTLDPYPSGVIKRIGAHAVRMSK